MILSDRDIVWWMERRGLVIDPYDSVSLNGAVAQQPASVDLRLSGEYKTIPGGNPVDPKEGLTEEDVIHLDSNYIRPEQFIIASTKERVEIPPGLVGKIEGRSSIGRLGLEVHATAGFIDPGFKGQITLELTNNSTRPIKLPEGLRICQIFFTKLASTPKEIYNSKYQGQEGPTISKIHEDVELDED